MIKRIRRFFLRLIYSGSPKLHSYEMRCLDCWKQQLSDNAAKILEQQLDRLDSFQRCMKDRLVIFHCLEDQQFRNWPRDILFPLRYDEIHVFRLKLKVYSGETARNLKAEIVLFQGRLSALEFNIPPAIGKKTFEIVGFEILADPMDKRIELTTRTITIATLPEEVASVCGGNSVDVKEPYPVKVRIERLKQLGCSLPSDYLKIIELFDGIDARDFEIYGLSSMWQHPQQGKSILVLAWIKGSGDIGVQLESQDSVVYYIDNETHEVEKMGGSLISAIKNKLAEIDN